MNGHPRVAVLFGLHPFRGKARTWPIRRAIKATLSASAQEQPPIVTPPPVVYRSAVQDDLPAICALGEEVNAIHHEAYPHVFAGRGKPDRDLAHWAASLGGDGSQLFVAEVDCRVVGFVTVAVITESHSLLQPLRFGRIGSASVAQRFRGRGIGSGLIRQAHDWVQAHGGHEIRLTVWAFNEAARRLYEELGYEIRSLNLACVLSRETNGVSL